MNDNDSDLFSLKQPIKLLSVVVAAYNEESTIANTMTRLRQVLDSLDCETEIIVVESNSSDQTRNILKSIKGNQRLNLFFQDSPKGKGSAVRLGLSKISGDVFLIYDADDEYDPGDIPKLLIPISSGRTSFVLGTRHEKGKAMRTMHDHTIRPILMNFAHVFFTGLLNIFFRVKLTDPFTMYKIFRSEVFLDVDLVSNRFDFDWELVAKAIRRGAKPIEIQVTYNSRSFSEGKKVRFLRDPLTWIVALIRFRFCKIKISS